MTFLLNITIAQAYNKKKITQKGYLSLCDNLASNYNNINKDIIKIIIRAIALRLIRPTLIFLFLLEFLRYIFFFKDAGENLEVFLFHGFITYFLLNILNTP